MEKMAEKSDKLPWGIKTEGLTPGTAKNIPKNKLKAFNIGTMNIKKGLSKKEQEEARKKNDEEALEDVYKDFVTSFEDAGKGINRAWVKGGLARGDKNSDDKEKKLYKPTSKLAELAESFKSFKDPDNEEMPPRRRGPPKRHRVPYADMEPDSGGVEDGAEMMPTRRQGGFNRQRHKFPEEDPEPTGMEGAADMMPSRRQGGFNKQRHKFPEDDPEPTGMEETADMIPTRRQGASKQRHKFNFPEDDPEPTGVEDPAEMAQKRKSEAKRKSNLELFKEELKVIQEERQERRKFKQNMNEEDESPARKSRFEPVDPPALATGNSLGLGPMDEYKGSVTYSDDTSTTNLYLGNLNPQMSEHQLCELFGRFGPLASVKIMWPRTEEERSRGRNCGFVAYMNRKDGERALTSLQGKDIMTFEMKLGWGKAVPIPPHPVYVPPRLAELTLPPPPSGLPFNGQPNKRQRRNRDRDRRGGGAAVPPPGSSSRNDSRNDSPLIHQPPPNDKAGMREFEKTLANAEVKVVIPTERPLLALIHRMIEFVVREGPMFEAMVMNREMNNPQFRFLFENQSPAHVYYRWKLFSILQGDSPYKWRMQPFRMFKGGSVWLPPHNNPYSQGMPEELVDAKDEFRMSPEPSGQPKRGQLSESQRDRLEDMLRELNPEREKIGDAMIWAIEHAESAEEIVECLSEALSILQTPLPKKVARLYLVSDILFNCSAKVPMASFYRKFFESKLPEIFKDMHDFYEKIEGRLKAEQFKQRVMACFRAWEDWQVYPNEYLIKLQNVFLGLVISKQVEVKDTSSEAPLADVDGEPISDLDGLPLDGSAITAIKEELDGAPLSEDIDGLPIGGGDVDGTLLERREEINEAIKSEEQSTKAKAEEKSMFIKSKWETVDETELERQAVTTSKWDMFDQYGGDSDDEEEGDGQEAKPRKPEYSDDLDGAPLNEDLDGAPLEEAASGEVLENSGRYDNGLQEDRRSVVVVDRGGRNEEERPGSPDSGINKTVWDEERRAKLREIEVKVMKYQDEVEAGKRSRKTEMTLVEQVEYYRKKLLNKEEERERDKMKDREREKERDRVKEWERAREKEKKREREERESYRQREKERDRERERERERERDRSERRSERDRSERRRQRSESPVQQDELGESKGSLSLLMRYGGSVSRSPSPDTLRAPPSASRHHRSRSGSPPGTYPAYYGEVSDSATPKRRSRKSRSRSPKGKQSRSARKTSRSNTPKKSKRSRSRSPSSKHKHKKHKRKD